MKTFALAGTALMLASLGNGLAEARDEDAINALADVIEANYYDEARAREIADSLRSEAAAGAFGEDTSPDALASALTGRLHAEDRHFSVRYIGPERAAEIIARREAAEAGEAPERPADPWAGLRRENFGFADIDILPGNIGYIDLRQFAPIQPAESTARAALDFIANTDAVIFDLRQNVGGAPSMVQYLISHFLDPEEPVVINTFVARDLPYPDQLWSLPVHPAGNRPDVPLIVLTSGNTGSAGEAFPYHLKAMERATIIGETTHGAGNPGSTFFTPEGYAVFISTGSARNPITGTNWEGTGVTPDIAVPAGDALETALDRLYETLLAAHDADSAGHQDVEWARELLAAQREPVAVASRQLRRYAGTYGNRHFDTADGTLVYTREGGSAVTLLPVGNHRFAIPGNNSYRFVFTPDEAGNVGQLEMQIAGSGSRNYPRSR